MGQNEVSEIDRAISALQDRTRRQILLDFYVHQPEWTVDDAAKAAGVHRTVAHGHLERLVARLAGLLAEGLQTRGQQGIEAAREAGRRYGAMPATRCSCWGS
ncbi:MAG TPA: hypothetical protein VIO37_05590 [Candidatus Dormibacteraeota bacterium]